MLRREFLKVTGLGGLASLLELPLKWAAARPAVRAPCRFRVRGISLRCDGPNQIGPMCEGILRYFGLPPIRAQFVLRPCGRAGGGTWCLARKDQIRDLPPVRQRSYDSIIMDDVTIPGDDNHETT